jgi:hypothetical protein
MINSYETRVQGPSERGESPSISSTAYSAGVGAVSGEIV